MKLYIREIGTDDIKGTVTVSNDYLTALISNLKKKMSKYALGFFPNIVDNGINISIYEAGEECCNVTIPRTVLIGNIDKDTDKIFNDYLMKDGYVGLYINRHNSEYESLKDKTTKLLKKENLHMIRKLHIKESEASNDIMSLIKDIPEKDIDHWETDLYLRKTPETTKVISKLPDVYKKNVTTFIDDIDHVPWYEIPFVFPKDRNRKGIKESVNLPKTLNIEFMSGLRTVPVTDKWPVGKHIWNIGNHNPYIDRGYVIVCNTRDYRVIPETLEFVYVGPENAKALHKRAGKGTVNDKNYTEYLVTDINLEEDCLMEDETIETYDVYYWDKEDMEHYNDKVVHMTSNEVKQYVDRLNANMDDYDRERGWWDYELS